MSTKKNKQQQIAFSTAKSIAKQYPITKFAFAPKSLEDLHRIDFLSAIAGYDVSRLASTRAILQKGFEKGYVSDVKRSFTSSQRSAIATADEKRIKYSDDGIDNNQESDE